MWGLGLMIKNYWQSIICAMLTTGFLLKDIYSQTFVRVDWFLLAVCIGQWHYLFKIYCSRFSKNSGEN